MARVSTTNASSKGKLFAVALRLGLGYPETVEPLTPKDPKNIGPFSIIARLGAGGMGSVYLGKRGIDQYAVKVINSSLLSDKNARKRFSAEVETLRKLDSEFIAKIVDAVIDADDPWLAMEFVNGPSLKELVTEKGPIGPDEWHLMAGNLLTALQELRSKGVIHRDLKPSNILISSEGPKLIDFGISTALDQTSITSTGSVVGSPAWLAPEQLEGTTITSAADAFSMGSVLAFAATGQSPWGDETILSAPTIFKRILDSEPDLAALEPLQQDLVLGLMHPRPSARLSPAEATRKLANKSAPVREKKKDPNPPNQAPSRKALFGVIAGVAAVAVVAGVALMDSSGTSSGPFGSNESQVACSETRWVGQDLSQSPKSAVESAWQRGSLLTLECTELEKGAPLILKAEFCQEMTSAPAKMTIRRLSGEIELEPRENVWSQSLDNRHGCRSFVEIGKMEWEASLGTSLSYQVNETVASESGEEGFYLLASDNGGGTFVSYANFRPTDDTRASVQLSADVYGPVALAISYDSGYFVREYKTGAAYVAAEFSDFGTQVVNFSCWHEDYLSELESENLVVEFQALSAAGDWVAIPGYWDGEPEDCGEPFKYLPLFTEEHALMPFLSRNQCAKVRFVSPNTPGFSAIQPTVKCVTLEASRIPAGEEVISDDEITLLLAMVDRKNDAIAASFDDWAESIESTNYPGLYAMGSDEWSSGMGALESDWDLHQDTRMTVSESGISLDPDWVHPESPCSVPQSTPLPGRTFLLRGTDNGVAVSFHYTILDGEVYSFLDGCG